MIAFKNVDFVARCRVCTFSAMYRNIAYIFVSVDPRKMHDIMYAVGFRATLVTRYSEKHTTLIPRALLW